MKILYVRDSYSVVWRIYKLMWISKARFAATNPPPAIGVSAEKDTLEWFWEKHFAAGTYPSLSSRSHSASLCLLHILFKHILILTLAENSHSVTHRPNNIHSSNGLSGLRSPSLPIQRILDS